VLDIIIDKFENLCLNFVRAVLSNESDTNAEREEIISILIIERIVTKQVAMKEGIFVTFFICTDLRVLQR
jgi:hypothetical protein